MTNVVLMRPLQRQRNGEHIMAEFYGLAQGHPRTNKTIDHTNLGLRRCVAGYCGTRAVLAYQKGNVLGP